MAKILDLWTAMMSDHEEFDPRIKLAEGARGAYRAYLNYHLSSDESRLAAAETEGEEGGRIVGFSLVTINRNLPMFMPPLYGYLSDIAVEPQRNLFNRKRPHPSRGQFDSKRQAVHLSADVANVVDFSEARRE